MDNEPGTTIFPIPIYTETAASLPFPGGCNVASSYANVKFSCPVSLVTFDVSKRAPGSSGIFVCFRVSGSLRECKWS